MVLSRGLRPRFGDPAWSVGVARRSPRPSACPLHLTRRGKASGSSKRYIRRQMTDPYGKHAASVSGVGSYVSRSAHKLIQLDQAYALFGSPTRDGCDAGPLSVVDLGAAPGGWAQVTLQALAQRPTQTALRRRLATGTTAEQAEGERPPPRHKLIACDLLPLDPAVASPFVAQAQGNGETGPPVDFSFVQGDFTLPGVQSLVASLLDRASASFPGRGSGRTVVLSDMLPALSGVGIRDAQASYDVCLAALELAERYIPPSEAEMGSGEGVLVMKHTQCELTDDLRQRIKQAWKTVKWAKPLASRAESSEGYFVVSGRKV